MDIGLFMQRLLKMIRRVLGGIEFLFRPSVRSKSTYQASNLPKIANDLHVFNGDVSFIYKEHRFNLATAWQDTMPSGSSVGTAICLHGSPGSHNDFKYITHFLKSKHIRVIGLNLPGIGVTSTHPKLSYDNDERDAFITAMVQKLAIKDNLVWVGHSRGNENALRCCVSMAEISKGAVLVNTTGFRPHKGIRPHWVIKLAAWADKTNVITRAIMNPITHRVYASMGLRTKSADVTGKCVRTMTTFDFHKLRPFVQKFNQNQHLRLFVVIAGKDFLVEEDITREFMHAFDNVHEKTVVPGDNNDEQLANKFVFEKFRSGHRSVGLTFPNDGHFMQKHRARLLADAIESMLLSGTKN